MFSLQITWWSWCILSSLRLILATQRKVLSFLGVFCWLFVNWELGLSRRSGCCVTLQLLFVKPSNIIQLFWQRPIRIGSLQSYPWTTYISVWLILLYRSLHGNVHGNPGTTKLAVTLLLNWNCLEKVTSCEFCPWKITRWGQDHFYLPSNPLESSFRSGSTGIKLLKLPRSSPPKASLLWASRARRSSWKFPSLEADPTSGSAAFLRPLTPLWPLMASSKPGGGPDDPEFVAAWLVSLGGGGRGGMGGGPLRKNS